MYPYLVVRLSDGSGFVQRVDDHFRITEELSSLSYFDRNCDGHDDF